MSQMTGTSASQPSHFVAHPDGARYEADEADGISHNVADDVTTGTSEHPNFAEPLRLGRIVVGVDGSDPSLRALAKAVSLAGFLSTTVQIVTTWKYFAAYADVSISEWSPEKDATEIMNGALGQQFGPILPGWVSISTLEGNAAQRLIDASEGAEMLVVGSRGHGGVVGLLLGSVSSACAEKAHCPVLVVH